MTYPWFYNSSLFILIDNVRMWLGRVRLERPVRGDHRGSWGTALQAGALTLTVALVVQASRDSRGRSPHNAISA